MTPREPDRYEEKARLDVRACFHYGTICMECHAAALRAVEAETLERAARVADESREDGRCIAFAIRALASPAAAPAAEMRTMSDEEARRRSTFDAQLAKAGCEPLAGSATTRCNCYPSIQCARVVHKETCPAFQPASEQDSQHADAQVEGARSAGCQTPLRGTASGLSSEPAPLLPRVLAALEEAYGFVPMAGKELQALAAELRAYIAEREPAEKRIAELETALRDALSAAHHHVQAGQHWICSEPFACEEECPCAKLAARAAKAKGEGT